MLVLHKNYIFCSKNVKNVEKIKKPNPIFKNQEKNEVDIWTSEFFCSVK